jgi:hypothetical protein
LSRFSNRFKKGFEVSKVRDRAVLAVLKELDLAENVSRRIVERRGRDENDPFAATDLRQLLIHPGHFGAEAVRLINEDVGVLRDVAPEQVVNFAYGFKLGLGNAEIAEDVGP